MDKISIVACAMVISTLSFGQDNSNMKVKRPVTTNKVYHLEKEVMTPEKLWELGRVSAEGLSADSKWVVYGVSNYTFGENKSEKNLYAIPVNGGEPIQLTQEVGSESVVQIKDNDEVVYLFKGQLWSKSLKGGEAKQLTNIEGGLENVKLSPDGRYIVFSRSVLVHAYHSKDKYNDLSLSDVYIYDDLDYRHWDTFNDGRFNHPFVATYDQGIIGDPIDILEGEPFYSPQAPYGGAEDYEWSPDSKALLYVCKKKFGKEYAASTNTDIYRYDLASKVTTNMTDGMNGYDTNPVYSPDGQQLAWLSMRTDGYEADKNDIIVFDKKTTQRRNLTAEWNGTVNSYMWSKDGRKIYFTAPIRGTVQLFEVDLTNSFAGKSSSTIKQISEGAYDISGLVGEVEDGLIVTSTTMTRATEVYMYHVGTRMLSAITHVNDAIYSKLAETKVEGRFTTASDGEKLFSWVIYPPNFDPAKKYPTLLFCQGGPQSATTLGYSFRWNFQLMASQGYIVILPNRRGMPGWGVKWNEDISKDWGGQPIRDYLSAIDDFAKEPYVDNDRISAIGASYGGYSVFLLAGVHEGRFKSFISHCGLFDMTSWYGTTEELFFANYDLGGAYWDNANKKAYTDFNPLTYVHKWNTPILIFQGGKDYRVPIGQGLAAFQAAQLNNVKSRLVYLPEENHWVLSGHNALVWQREFFTWLKETL